MTLNELLEKPVWQMKGEELLFLTQQKVMQPEGAESEMSSAKEERHFVYGLSGLARLFGCSLPPQPIASSRVERSIGLSLKSDERSSSMQTLPLS
jgi:hypothetical protein